MTDPGPDQDTREAARLFHLGIALLPLTTAALVLGLGLGLADGAYAAFLLTTLPVLGMAQLPLLHRTEIDRMAAYAASSVMILVLATVALVLAALGPGLAALGLVGVPPLRLALLTGAVVGGVVLLAGFFHLVEKALGIDESRVLKALIPRTRNEKRLFGVLSLTAGVGEEIVYRGYLLAVLVPVFSDPLVAALVSSLAFGLLHAYQGPIGIVRTSLLGFLFAGAFLETGVLWPLILTHLAVDLVSGLWLGPSILNERTPPP